MFKGLGNLADMGKMMKAAQEMQTKMTALQEELNTMTVVGESGAGLVKATSTAKGELTALDNALERLSLFLGGKGNVTIDVVDQTIAGDRDFNVFELSKN